MCARFTLAVPDLESLGRMLAAAVDPALAELYRPRYNVAPSDVHLVLRERAGRRELIPAVWGLVNRWTKDPKGAGGHVNARSEGVRVKPAFREAFARRRCIVPADGFYEWTGPKKARKPIWFAPASGGLLHLAGLYESWRDPADGQLHPTFTILTTAANEAIAPVHDRMPAILAPEDLGVWLDAEQQGDGGQAEALLRPAPPGLLSARPVSPRVNSVANDDPSLLQPAPSEAQQTLSLFDPTPRR